MRAKPCRCPTEKTPIGMTVCPRHGLIGAGGKVVANDRIAKAEKAVVAAAVKWRNRWVDVPLVPESHRLYRAVDALCAARKGKR